ncbi:MAG: hypothetical protein AAF921_09735 [Cyanobacteria bacterium P01_D01_bin.44]
MARLIVARNSYRYSYTTRTKDGSVDNWLACDGQYLDDVVLDDHVLKGYWDVLPTSIQLSGSGFEDHVELDFEHCEITTIDLWDIEKGEPHTLYVTVKDESELSDVERLEIRQWLSEG